MINIIEIIDSLKDDKDIFTVKDEKLKLNLFSFHLVPKIRDLFLEFNKDIPEQFNYATSKSSLWLNPQPRNMYKEWLPSTPLGGFLGSAFASVGYRPERKREKPYKGLKKSGNTFFSLPYFEIELFIANAKIGIGLSFFREQELSIFKKYIKKYNDLVVGAMEWAGIYRYPTYIDAVLPIDYLSDIKEEVHFISLPISIDSFDLLKFNQFKNIHIALFAIYYDILIAAETGKIKSYGIECFNNFYEKNLFQEFASYEKIDEIKQEENKVTAKTIDFFSHIQSGIRYRVLTKGFI
ncbi:hypothetical protein HZA55_01735 [Candidatus Poribacteria bacterium]|nr:hypothetical protein [Candidatus Poribacteria bacterium]